jgi:hypothetical protein
VAGTLAGEPDLVVAVAAVVAGDAVDALDAVDELVLSSLPQLAATRPSVTAATSSPRRYAARPRCPRTTCFEMFSFT